MTDRKQINFTIVPDETGRSSAHLREFLRHLAHAVRLHARLLRSPAALREGYPCRRGGPHRPCARALEDRGAAAGRAEPDRRAAGTYAGLFRVDRHQLGQGSDSLNLAAGVAGITIERCRRRPLRRRRYPRRRRPRPRPAASWPASQRSIRTPTRSWISRTPTSCWSRRFCPPSAPTSASTRSRRRCSSAIPTRARSRRRRPTNSNRKSSRPGSSAPNRDRSSGWRSSLVERHGGEVPKTMDALVELPGVGRKTANVVLGHALGVPGPAGRPARAPRREPNRHRAVGGSRGRRAAARPSDAAGGVDAGLRHADSARPPHLQTEAALRSVRRPRRLQLLPRAAAPAAGARSKKAGARDARAIHRARRGRARSESRGVSARR